MNRRAFWSMGSLSHGSLYGARVITLVPQSVPSRKPSNTRSAAATLARFFSGEGGGGAGAAIETSTGGGAGAGPLAPRSHPVQRSRVKATPVEHRFRMPG